MALEEPLLELQEDGIAGNSLLLYDVKGKITLKIESYDSLFFEIKNEDIEKLITVLLRLKSLD